MKKTFDAVAFQRQVRERLSQQYRTQRDQLLQDLRQRYGYLRTRTTETSKKTA